MKKLWKCGLAISCVAALLAGCGSSQNTMENSSESVAAEVAESKIYEGATYIELADEGILVNEEAISHEATEAVYAANDIVYYEEGQDFTYGEGTEEDAHSKEEADKHTVVHITKPGTYVLSGSLSAGQIAVDLGEDAKEDPEAVVTLVLNGVDITNTVAPGVIFYNVYECGDDDAENASSTVDTTNAGANVILADGSVNKISGSYVAKIYESVELNEAGTEVADSEKLHKYDGAFYSKMSMNVSGEDAGTGELYIYAENEGLDSELHLTINGGNIYIYSGNDGINTNEDGVSVITINDGSLFIRVEGTTGEGDGIDSNGYLVINGGSVFTEANSDSQDAGIDSDMGIFLQGGTVAATGNMLDAIEDSGQTYVVFSFAEKQQGNAIYILKDEDGQDVLSVAPANAFSYLLVSSEELAPGTYTLWQGDSQLSGVEGGNAGAPGQGMHEGFTGEKPEGMEAPEGMEKPEGMEAPEGMEKPEGVEAPEGMEKPEGVEVPEGMKKPEGMEAPEGMEKPEGMEAPEGMDMPAAGERTTQFTLVAGGNYFSNVGIAE